MSTITVNEIECSRRKLGGLDRASALPADDVRIREAACHLALGGGT
jgi:hypothetical protein